MKGKMPARESQRGLRIRIKRRGQMRALECVSCPDSCAKMHAFVGKGVYTTVAGDLEEDGRLYDLLCELGLAVG